MPAGRQGALLLIMPLIIENVEFQCTMKNLSLRPQFVIAKLKYVINKKTGHEIVASCPNKKFNPVRMQFHRARNYLIPFLLLLLLL